MLGRPKYTYEDVVKFKISGREIVGKVYIVDAYGTFDQDSQPSYDIIVDEENFLYKHIPESCVYQ